MSSRPYEKVSPELKKLIIDGYFKRDYRMSYLSEIYHVKYSNVINIIKKCKTQSGDGATRKNCKKLLSGEQIDKLLQWKDELDKKALKDLSKLIEDNFEIKLSLPAIRGYLNDEKSRKSLPNRRCSR